MGDNKGFIRYKRKIPVQRPVLERTKDFKEINIPFSEEDTHRQASRCMDCGVPFCHDGCPLGNLIPDFNDAVYSNDFKKAYTLLSDTNNFPEFTGRICPAPCEKACVLGINSDPVTIEYLEKTIIERAFQSGWVKPDFPSKKTCSRIAIVGSGPAGLAAAVQLNLAGHSVRVYEKSDLPGGLLQYGIPDFKLEKWIVERRIDLMKESGIEFQLGCNVGVDIDASTLLEKYDAIVLAGGSTVPRDLGIPGRELKGIHYAMEYLEQKNRQVAGQKKFDHPLISAKNKNVIVLGGGDTGADCVGTSNRDQATHVTQIELLTEPPSDRHKSTPWPTWPMQLRTSSSHEEGCDRKWSILTKEFLGDKNGHVSGLKVIEIEWYFDENENKSLFREIPGTEEVLKCDLVLVAIGFVHPIHEGMLTQLALTLDERGNVRTTQYQTNITKVFCAGDMRRGQSLVVWAITEGREAAIEVDKFLLDGKTSLKSKSYSKLLV